MLGLVVEFGLTLKVGVGQVIQGDCLLHGKQRCGSPKDMRLDGVAMLHQGIRGPVQAVVREPREVHIKQFAQGTLGL